MRYRSIIPIGRGKRGHLAVCSRSSKLGRPIPKNCRGGRYLTLFLHYNLDPVEQLRIGQEIRQPWHRRHKRTFCCITCIDPGPLPARRPEDRGKPYARHDDPPQAARPGERPSPRPRVGQPLSQEFSGRTRWIVPGEGARHGKGDAPLVGSAPLAVPVYCIGCRGRSCAVSARSGGLLPTARRR